MKANYSVQIIWSEEDAAFLACIPELPGCMADGATREEALACLAVVEKEWLETAKQQGREIPPPTDCAAAEAMCTKFREDLQAHVKREVENAVQRVLSEVGRMPVGVGCNDPADWWKAAAKGAR